MPPGTFFTAEVRISGGLRSTSSSVFTAFITAIIAAIVGAIATAIIGYYYNPIGSNNPTKGNILSSTGGHTEKPIRPGPLDTTVIPDITRWVAVNEQHIEWRIKSVNSRSDKLSMVLQIRNTNTSSSSSFYDFKRAPLAVIDANGTYHDMTNTSDPPSGVQVQPWNVWTIQGGRVIDVVVEFQPLTSGATGGKVLYKADNHAEPLTF